MVIEKRNIELLLLFIPVFVSVKQSIKICSYFNNILDYGFLNEMIFVWAFTKYIKLFAMDARQRQPKIESFS